MEMGSFLQIVLLMKVPSKNGKVFKMVTIWMLIGKGFRNGSVCQVRKEAGLSLKRWIRLLEDVVQRLTC
ncbi:hypothetical protein C5167_014709 [Papaver somniferum]|uniref:Uncharacterized protein n=1 Tax=Papaver somniferum TaxID=3469 RepID=A0A4Y7J7H3_PAPSO|nr:hypothetical protein C5167_014709 [Papaver somniferum]